MVFARLNFPKVVVIVALLSVLASPVVAQNWPQWRGANLDNISESTDLPVEFNQEKNLLWKATLPGPAGATPVVWENQVFVTTPNTETNELELHCFDATTGDSIWKKILKGENDKVRDGASSASPSPSTDGNHVWANTGAGFIECFTMDGEPVWSVDLQKKYGRYNIMFGMTSTPIVDNGNLFLQLIHGNMRKGTSRGHVVSLDGTTGEELWHHIRETDGVRENVHSYASPLIVREGDVEYLVSHGADYVIGHSLDDGSELWRCGGLNPHGPAYVNTLRFVASPTFANGMLVVPSAKKNGVIALKPDLTGDVTDDKNVKFWTLPKGTPDVACPLIHDGYVYLADVSGILNIHNAETGKKCFRDRMFADRHRSTPVYADGRIYIAGRKGTVVVLEPGESGKVLAENELGEEITASPAIAGSRIYVRTWDTLYCFSKE